jgi:hypothetical protein
MHLQVGDNLHGVVRGNQIVLVPCTCGPPAIPSPFFPDAEPLPEVKLPAATAMLFPVRLYPEED